MRTPQKRLFRVKKVIYTGIFRKCEVLNYLAPPEYFRNETNDISENEILFLFQLKKIVMIHFLLW